MSANTGKKERTRDDKNRTQRRIDREALLCFALADGGGEGTRESALPRATCLPDMEVVGAPSLKLTCWT